MVATAVALAAPAAAGAKLLDDYYNEGIEPHADLGESRKVNNPKRFRVEVNASQRRQIHGDFTVKCYSGRKAKFSRNVALFGLPPVAAVVPIKGRFGYCRVTTAEARFADPFISGWIQIRVFGN